MDNWEKADTEAMERQARVFRDLRRLQSIGRLAVRSTKAVRAHEEARCTAADEDELYCYQQGDLDREDWCDGCNQHQILGVERRRAKKALWAATDRYIRGGGE